MDKNQRVWDSADVVAFYEKRIEEGAQMPEIAILDILGDISDASLLDIGIGTGRTTAFLNCMVRKYTGIDYSQRMIEQCKKRFKGLDLQLKKADARKLWGFLDNSFDICFFSFNGIDYITEMREREGAIQEIRRVLKPGGYFIFSSHNLYNLPIRSKLFQFEKSLTSSVKSIIRSMIFHSQEIFSRNSEKTDFMVLNDGALRFRLNTFYVKPDYQIMKLSSMNFDQIRIFDLQGKQIQGNYESTAGDYYLYYSCKKKGQ